jgi:hypothetical protein
MLKLLSAIVTMERELLQKFEQKGQNLRCSVAITIFEIYGQCVNQLFHQGSQIFPQVHYQP